MRCHGAAAALRGKAQPFDDAVFDAEPRRLSARYTPALIAQARRACDIDRRAILVMGLPLSGTTLVEQILSAHPDVAAVGEVDFWNQRGAASVRPGAAGTGSAFLVQAAADYAAVLRAVSADAKRVTNKLPFTIVWPG